MTELILTEKYSVAADFAKALDVRKKGDGFFESDNYIITWAVGHLVELFEPEDYDISLKKWRLETLPVIPEKFRYKPIVRSIKQFNIIKRLLKSKNFDQVIIATDAGREGEVIARTILLEAGFTDKQKIKRFWTSQALVPEVVRDTMNKLSPVTDYDRLWRAGYYRQVADWLVGMNCTRVLTVRLNDLFSVGRVQTAVLALLVDRKIDRDNFIPQTYWVIKADFFNAKGRWTGNWFRKKESNLNKKKDVEELIEKLSIAKNQGNVLSVNKQKKKEAPPLLFSLTELQQEANIKFGFSAKKTLNIAQSLYQDKKCLSYPRTDSKVLGTKNLNLVTDIIGKLKTTYGETFQNIDYSSISLSNKRVFNDARLTDHHALIPFKPLAGNATGDEFKVFNLVLKRFAAAFHPDCEFEQTNVVTELSGETFKTFGKVILVLGWREIYKQDKAKQGKNAEVKTIPPLAKGDSANCDKVFPKEKQTTPPPEYTDALILKDMTNPGKFVDEDEIKKFFRGDTGIGTQSTRAQIIETLLTRKYADRVGKTIIGTEKGVFLIKTLRKTKTATVLTSPEETARWEMNLNRIALGDVLPDQLSSTQGDYSPDRGKNNNLQFLKNIKEFVTSSVNELKTAELGQRPPAANSNFSGFDNQTGFNKLDGLCPDCGGEITENRKAYGCIGKVGESGGCGFVIWAKIARKNISLKMAENLLKLKKTGPFKGFVSKKKKKFSASLKIETVNGQSRVAFDFDNSGSSLSTDQKFLSDQDSSIKQDCLTHNELAQNCPVCGGIIIEGKKGFGCSNWKPENGGCRFVIWKEIFGKKVTKKNIETLLRGKITRVYVFKANNGEKFKGKMKMSQKSPGQFIILIMPDKTLNNESLMVQCISKE